jgi:hypothetical protein
MPNCSEEKFKLRHYRVQPRRVVQSEEPVGHAALLRKRRENGSGVPTYPLNPTWPEQFRE